MGCRHKYTYDAVFGPSVSQKDVYERTAKDLVAQTLDGINSTVFAYGATGNLDIPNSKQIPKAFAFAGSGKTFTMLGLDADKYVPQL